YHQETSSLNNESRSVPQVMIIQDQLKTKERWRHYFDHDPAYSLNLSMRSEDFSLAWPPGRTVTQSCEGRLI
ncbi:MAG: hypothetical protein U9R57_03840, partial [Thermodesulfobacteriota bacterium]|nr:hypothetical protein [Thermodesulfobacteriota bacterium]